MINDSAREELKAKVSSADKAAKFDPKGKFPMPNQKNHSATIVNGQKPTSVKTNTSEIFSNPTNPTLVEFHNKNATVPEWRLQLQNTVRQRQGRAANANAANETTPVQRTKLVVSGATALKVEPIENSAETEIDDSKNPTLASALRRINDSRQKFLTEEEDAKPELLAQSTAPNKYPFRLAKKTNDFAAIKSDVNPAPDFSQKPKIAASLKKTGEDFDTNKLPPLPAPAKISTSFESQPAIVIEAEAVAPEEEVKAGEEIKVESKSVSAEEVSETVEILEPEIEEIDDCAPLAMRFNAGFFDLIIGSFAALILLSPFMLMGGSWFTLSGLAAFGVTCAVVMFLYMTTTIAMYGKTYGMRLFSLEVIDIDGENYPTLHQAAVSSSLYLVSLALGGAGFLTMFFNEDKRAVHDLISGTVVVREF